MMAAWFWYSRAYGAVDAGELRAEGQILRLLWNSTSSASRFNACCAVSLLFSSIQTKLAEIHLPPPPLPFSSSSSSSSLPFFPYLLSKQAC